MSTAQAPAPERVRRVSPLRGLITRPEFGAIVGTTAVFLIFSAIAGGSGFLSVLGAANFLEVAAQVGIIGSAVSLLMIAGEFDLSVGSMVGAAGMIVALGIAQFGLPPVAAVALAFVFALFVGWLNGTVVVRTGLPSFIVTLGSLFILRGATIGLTRFVTGRTQVGGLDEFTRSDPFSQLFTAFVGIPQGTATAQFKVAIVWWIGLALLATFILLRTPFGNWIFGAGGSAVAARNVGVPVARGKGLLFMATAASAALLACIQVLSVGSGDVLRGGQKEFEAIITAVIGGTILTGGYGSAIGTTLGALTLGMTQMGIIFAGIPADWYQFVLGGLLLAAVFVNDWVRRRASETRR